MRKDRVRQDGISSFPIIAISTIDMISPPPTPKIAQPRICLVAASMTTFINPRVSPISIARATWLIRLLAAIAEAIHDSFVCARALQPS